MASKVNSKFILILALGAALVCGAAGAAYFLTVKSADDLLRRGDAAAAKGDWEAAAAEYGKATFKAKTNAQILEKWLAALEKTSPKNPQLFRERYEIEYVPGVQRLANLRRVDVAAHARYFDMRLDHFRTNPREVAAWQGFVAQIETAIRLFGPNDKSADRLKRYRGLARVEMIYLNANLKEEEKKECESDLRAALAADPQDELSCVNLAKVFVIQASPLRAKGNEVGARELETAAKTLLDAFLKDHSPAPRAQSLASVLARDEVIRRSRTESPPKTPAQIAASLVEEMSKPMAAILASDPKSLDSSVVREACMNYMSTTGNKGFDEVMKVFQHALKGQPGNAFLIYDRASIAQQAQKYAEAIEFMNQVLAMPDQPLGLSGLMMFGIRDDAQRMIAEALLSMHSQEKDVAKRGELLTQAKQARDKYKERTGGTTAALYMINARLAIAENNMSEARQLLSKYNEMQAFKDSRGLYMLATILFQENNLGGARQQLQRMVDGRMVGPEVYNMLMEIAIRQQNYAEAQRWAERLLDFAPGDAGLLSRIETLKGLQLGDRGSDPFLKKSGQVFKIFEQTAPDLEEAKRLAQELFEIAEKGTDNGRLAGTVDLLARVGLKDEAVRACELYLTRVPADERMKKTLEYLKAADPVALQVAEIEKAAVPDVVKWLQKAALYDVVGRNAEALAAFDEAKKLDAEHPAVIALEFERALGTGKLDEADRLAKLAEQKNFDKMKGKPFRIRLLEAQGKGAEAITMAKQVAEEDKLNPTAWRILGEMQVRARAFGEAVQSFRQAVNIRPNDATSIAMLAESLTAMGQASDALMLCRQNVQFAGGDQRFQNILLDLEFKVGNREAAIERRRREFKLKPDSGLNTAKFAEWLLEIKKVDEIAAPIAKLKELKAPGAFVLEVAFEVLRNDEAAAMKALDAYVEAAPKEARNGQAHIAVARALLQLGDPYAKFTLKVLDKGRGEQLPAEMIVDKEIGDISFQMGKNDEAIEAYKRVLAGISDDKGQRVMKRLGECYQRAGRWTDVLELFANVPASTEDMWQIHLLRAEAHNGLDDKARAREALNQAVKIAPDNAMVFFKRGQFLLREKAFEADGQADLLKAIRLNPKMFPARQVLGGFYARQGENAKMIALVLDGIKADPSDDQARAMVISALAQLGKFEEANAQLKEALELSRDNPQWLNFAAEIYSKQGNFAKVVEMYAKVWDQVKHPIAARRLVDAYLLLTPPNVAAARDLLAHSDAHTDDIGPLLMARARVALLDGNPVAAQKDILSAMSKLNKNSLGDNNRFAGDIEVVFKNDRGETLKFLKANEPKEGYAEPMRFHIARIMASHLPTADDGTKRLNEIATGAQDVEVRIAANQNLGELHYGAKRYGDAVAAFRRNVELKPSDPQGLNNLAYILVRYLNKAEEALPLAEKAAKLRPDESGYADTLGTVYMGLKQYDKAEAAFKKAIGIAEDSLNKTPGMLHLAEMYIARGERAKAEELVRDVERYAGQDDRIKKTHGSDLDSVKKSLGR